VPRQACSCQHGQADKEIGELDCLHGRLHFGSDMAAPIGHLAPCSSRSSPTRVSTAARLMDSTPSFVALAKIRSSSIGRMPARGLSTPGLEHPSKAGAHCVQLEGGFGILACVFQGAADKHKRQQYKAGSKRGQRANRGFAMRSLRSGVTATSTIWITAPSLTSSILASSYCFEICSNSTSWYLNSR